MKIKSIRGRLIGTYFLLTLLTILLIEGLFFIGINNYYLTNIEESLRQQAQLAAGFYEQYLGEVELEREAASLVEGFAGVTAAEVQVIDNKGRVLADSLQKGYQQALPNPDVSQALAGELSAWQGIVPDTGEPVLAVSAPLQKDGQVVGAVRYLTSLLPLKKVLVEVFLYLILLGLGIILLVIIAGLLFSRTVIGPVQEITGVAGRIAAGDLSARAIRHYDDEIGQLAETLNLMADELGRLDRLKNEFISSISHELRTPLTSIKGWVVTLLEDAEVRSDVCQGLDIIHRETDRLTYLVDEILDFSRLQAGGIRLKLQRVDLSSLINDIVRQMNPRAVRLGLELLFHPSYQPCLLAADPDRLKQVVINLLDNSFKFTPAGGKVEIGVGREGEKTVVFVKDTGVGIPPEELPLVTQRFYQGKGAVKGSGLGLAICREIALLHGGDLEINSSPGEGTTVLLKLPANTDLVRRSELEASTTRSQQL